SMPTYSWVWEKEQVTPPAASVEISRSKNISEEKLAAAAGNVTQANGPNRNGTWENPTFSTDWNNTPPELIWRRPIGGGWSGFSVVDGRAYTHEQDGDTECVSCLDLFTGETLWQHRDEGVRLLLAKPDATMGGDGPRSTPTFHNGRVYALGATGIINCLKAENGNLIWSRNIIEDFGGEWQDWGQANSPLVIPEHEILVVPGSKVGGVSLAAFRLDDGETAWTYEGSGATYSSPRIVEMDGVSILLSINAKNVTGHEPETGEVLWEYDWVSNYPRSGQPQRVGDQQLLFTGSYGMGSPLVEVTRSGDTWAVEEIWKSNRLKTKFSTAVIHENLAVGLDEGRIAAIDLEDGSIVWKGEKYGFGQNLKFGNYLLVQVEKGPVAIGRITSEGFEETGRIEDALSSMTWNPPTVAGRFLLVRNDKEAVCYLLPAL
ncbi:MAG: PQQ-binding-like beta-propeller repeat protein, partial [Verrucomicrobiota bacterium]